MLRALGLGDLLTAVPALRALHDHRPDAELVLATTPGVAALGRVLPGVDRVVEVAELAPLPDELAGADLAVNLHGSGPESHRLLDRLRPDRLVAFDRPDVPRTTGPAWDHEEHEVARWCRLLEEEGISTDASRLDVALPPGPVPGQAIGATVVHPGAKAGARRWPASRFADVARHVHARGDGVVVTGSPDERDLAEQVAVGAGLPSSAVLAGTTDVLGLGRVVAAARRVVCSDTGVAHLAAATRTPSVVLFGPTPPHQWGPPDRPWHRVLWRGQTGDPLADEPFPGLVAIGVGEVLDALHGLDALIAPTAPAATVVSRPA